MIDDDDTVAAPTQITVQIADIALREAWQVREKIDENLIRDYAVSYRSGANFPPIRLANLGGALVLVDGWHRLAALKRIEETTANAVVVATTEEDARWEAAIANTTNGKRLRHREKLNVFCVYMDSKRHLAGRRTKSYREIQRDLRGLASRGTLYNWMKSRYPKIASQMASGREDNKGGDPLTPPPSHYERTTRAVLDALRQVVAEARGLCPTARLLLVQDADKAIEAIRGASAWKAEPANPDF